MYAKQTHPEWKSRRYLVIDDEESLCEILQFNLEVEGFSVDVAYNAEEALKKDITRYDLILLDVMMGETSGFKLARQLKNNPETAHIPIIFCTAKDSEDDTVIGLEIGADDYITKPFSIREVIARVKSVLRRAAITVNREKADDSVAFQGLVLNLQRKTCHVDGKEVKLTKTEFEILLALPAPPRDHLLSGRHSEPGLEQRRHRARPHHRRQHHPTEKKD